MSGYDVQIIDSGKSVRIRIDDDEGGAMEAVFPREVVGQLSEKLHDHINKGGMNNDE